MSALAHGTEKRKSMVRIALSIALGAALGYAYHRVVGCRTGACPITASPWASTIYGAVMGFLFSGGMR